MKSGLEGVLQCKDLLLDSWWKIHKYEMVFVIQVILATLIGYPHQIVPGCTRIGTYPINFAGDEGCVIPGVINTEGEGFRRCFHGSST
jgi:hypothetical protein